MSPQPFVGRLPGTDEHLSFFIVNPETFECQPASNVVHLLPYIVPVEKYGNIVKTYSIPPHLDCVPVRKYSISFHPDCVTVQTYSVSLEKYGVPVRKYSISPYLGYYKVQKYGVAMQIYPVHPHLDCNPNILRIEYSKNSVLSPSRPITEVLEK